MGDRGKQALRVQFHGKLKIEFHGVKVTRDAGLLAFRELDEAFRLTERGSTVLSDPRYRKNTKYTMLAMLRQSVYGSLAGYKDVNDAERLRVGPALRRVVGGWAKEKLAVSRSEMNRFEREKLSSRENLTALMIRVGHGLTLRPSGGGIVVPENSGAGLARWRSHGGTNRGKRGRFAGMERFVGIRLRREI